MANGDEKQARKLIVKASELRLHRFFAVPVSHKKRRIGQIIIMYKRTLIVDFLCITFFVSTRTKMRFLVYWLNYFVSNRHIKDTLEIGRVT